MKKEYLKPGDPGSFDSGSETWNQINVREKPEWCKNNPEWQMCQKCQGHGTWNLELNAYGPGRHFQAFCTVCNGQGWTNNQCDHDNEFVQKLGECYNQYKCSKCGRIDNVDSSG